MKPVHMRKNKRYKIVHMIKGVQKYPRESVLVFLGVNRYSVDYGPIEYEFSGRDFKRDTRVCGTASLTEPNIISVDLVADDEPLYVNRRASTQSRQSKQRK